MSTSNSPTDKNISLLWVLDHEGLPGNEEVDCIVKADAEADFVGLEPFFGVPKTYLRNMEAWEH